MDTKPKFDATEKHIVAHGRMTNLIYKYFYNFNFKSIGQIVGTTGEDYYLCEFRFFTDLAEYEFQRILHIDELRNSIFSRRSSELREITEPMGADTMEKVMSKVQNVIEETPDARR